MRIRCISRKIHIILLSVLLLFSFSYGQKVKKVGTSAAAFLKIPAGTRATAMGNAFVGVANDPSTVIWNVGGITSIEKTTIYVEHTNWLVDLKYDFMAAIVPFGNMGTAAVYVVTLGTPEMQVTTVDNPEGLPQTFDARSTALGISFARKLMTQFSIGGTFKYINERIFNSSASGIAFDLGTIYTTPFWGIKLGVGISNFGSKLRIMGEDLNRYIDIAPNQNGTNKTIVSELKTDEFDLPLIMRLGLSWDHYFNNDTRLTIAMDGVNPNDNSQSVNMGFELGLFKERVKLMGGLNDLFLEDKEYKFSWGFLVNIREFQTVSMNFGYSYQEFEHLGSTNRFAFSFQF